MAKVKMTPSEALVETLVVEGVDTVFGIAEVLAEPFRRDALNMPVRYLDKYQHLNG